MSHTHSFGGRRRVRGTSPGSFASRRSPVRSRLAPLRKALVINIFPRSGASQESSISELGIRIGHQIGLPHLTQTGDGAVPAPTAGYSTTNALRASCSEVDRPEHAEIAKRRCGPMRSLK